MKIAVLGATGPSGQCLVKQALDAGHDVIALVRNPEKLTVSHTRLKREKVDIFSDTSLSPHLEGCDLVMSCLGCKPSWSPISFYQDTIQVLAKAMKTAKVTRLICMTARCTVPDRSNPWFMEWIIRPLFLGRTLESMSVMEQYLYQQHDINYTIIKPGGLSNGPMTDRPIKTVEGQLVPDGLGGRIPRADVARFMMTCMDDTQWDYKGVAISY